MASEHGCARPNPYIFEIEEKRKKKMHRLAHELGAGSPCQKCGDKCPGFDLHFWRKVCNNCRCGKAEHSVEDDDDPGFYLIGRLFDRPLRTKQEEMSYCYGTEIEMPDEKSSQPGKTTSVKFDWVPPRATAELVQRYMQKIPAEKQPISGTEGALNRKKQLERQVPAHDLDATICDNLSPKETQSMLEYVEHVKKNAVGQGEIRECPQPQVPRNASSVAQQMAGMHLTHPDDRNVVGHPQFSQPVRGQMMTWGPGHMMSEVTNVPGQHLQHSSMLLKQPGTQTPAGITAQTGMYGVQAMQGEKEELSRAAQYAKPVIKVQNGQSGNPGAPRMNVGLSGSAGLQPQEAVPHLDRGDRSGEIPHNTEAWGHSAYHGSVEEGIAKQAQYSDPISRAYRGQLPSSYLQHPQAQGEVIGSQVPSKITTFQSESSAMPEQMAQFSKPQKKMVTPGGTDEGTNTWKDYNENKIGMKQTYPWLTKEDSGVPVDQNSSAKDHGRHQTENLNQSPCFFYSVPEPYNPNRPTFAEAGGVSSPGNVRKLQEKLGLIGENSTLLTARARSPFHSPARSPASQSPFGSPLPVKKYSGKQLQVGAPGNKPIPGQGVPLPGGAEHQKPSSQAAATQTQSLGQSDADLIKKASMQPSGERDVAMPETRYQTHDQQSHEAVGKKQVWPAPRLMAESSGVEKRPTFHSGPLNNSQFPSAELKLQPHKETDTEIPAAPSEIQPTQRPIEGVPQTQEQVQPARLVGPRDRNWFPGHAQTHAEAEQYPEVAMPEDLSGFPLLHQTQAEPGNPPEHTQLEDYGHIPVKGPIFGEAGQGPDEYSGGERALIQQLWKCEECLEMMSPGEIAIFAERAGHNKCWHPQCFVCVTCQELLVDLIYFFKEGNIYCGRHFAEKMNIPRCNACDELIFAREYTMAEGSSWHMKHFCCYLCDIPLAGKQYVPVDGQPHCLDCYNKKYGKTCLTCHQSIAPDVQRVGLKDQFWHATSECFCCSICNGSLLGGKFMQREGKLFCSKQCAQRAVAVSEL